MSDVTRRMAKSEAQVKATPSETPNLDELRGIVRQLDWLTVDPRPGSSTWRQALDAQLRAIQPFTPSHGKLLEALKAYDKAVTALTDQQLIDNQPLMAAVLGGRAAVKSAEESPNKSLFFRSGV